MRWQKAVPAYFNVWHSRRFSSLHHPAGMESKVAPFGEDSLTQIALVEACLDFPERIKGFRDRVSKASSLVRVVLMIGNPPATLVTQNGHKFALIDSGDSIRARIVSTQR